METENYDFLNNLIIMLQPKFEKVIDSGSKVIQLGGEEIFLISNKGIKRDENQDRVAFALIGNQLSTGSSLAVAVLVDGMGGMECGAKAASIAISSFISYIATGHTGAGLKALTLKAIHYANQRVFDFFNGQGGTTLSAIVFGSKGSVGINVGDSRIYYLHEKKEIKQLTTDDTIEGQIRQESERDNNWLNPLEGDSRLAQYIGMGEGMDPHLLDLSDPIKGEIGEDFLLTSDGSHYLGNLMLQKIVKKSESKDQIPYRIAMTSEWLGGHDNSSLILIPSKISFNQQSTNMSVLSLEVMTISDEFRMAIPKYNALLNDLKAMKEKYDDLKKNYLNVLHSITEKQKRDKINEKDKVKDIKEEKTSKQEKKDNVSKKKSKKKKKYKKKDQDENLTLNFITKESGEDDQSTR